MESRQEQTSEFNSSFRYMEKLHDLIDEHLRARMSMYPLQMYATLSCLFIAAAPLMKPDTLKDLRARLRIIKDMALKQNRKANIDSKYFDDTEVLVVDILKILDKAGVLNKYSEDPSHSIV